VTRADAKWVKGFLQFMVGCCTIQGIPPPLRADDWLWFLRNALCELEQYLADVDPQTLREASDEAGIPRELQSAFWTRRRADAARLRRVLNDERLPRLLDRWERRRVFTDRAGG
jgi:hypothetical protein